MIQRAAAMFRRSTYTIRDKKPPALEGLGCSIYRIGHEMPITNNIRAYDSSAQYPSLLLHDVSTSPNAIQSPARHHCIIVASPPPYPVTLPWPLDPGKACA